MINKVSSINFKGFYSKKNERYSDSQNRCIDNIKKELGDEIQKRDFYVEAGYGDTVELSTLSGLREGIGVEDSYCKHVAFVGTFDEKHPFKKEDLKKHDKEETAKVLTLAIPTLMLLCGSICLMVRGCTNTIKEALHPTQVNKSLILTVKDSATLAKEISEAFMK